MLEKNFWTKYFTAKYLHSTKNSIVAAAEATEDEELVVFLKHDDILIRRVDLTLDMEVGDGDDYTHILNKNMYSMFALESSTKGESNGDASRERVDKVSRITEIENLQGPNNLPLSPFCIKDPQDYFDSQQANALRTSRDALSGAEQTKYNLSTQEVANGGTSLHTKVVTGYGGDANGGLACGQEWSILVVLAWWLFLGFGVYNRGKDKREMEKGWRQW
ncbi:hypothetical protein REPUB_Repub05bG0136700 [Reevesia pubescens]